jgi:hypothetical protein
MNLLIKKFLSAFVKFFLLFGVMVAVMSPLGWLEIHHPKNLQLLTQIMSQLEFFFIIFRWSLIGFLIYFWPRMVRYFAEKQKWSLDKTNALLQERYHIAIWLILVEILVCENLLLMVIKHY